MPGLILIALLLAGSANAQALLRYPGDRPGGTAGAGGSVEITYMSAIGDSITAAGSYPYPWALRLNILIGSRWDISIAAQSGGTASDAVNTWTANVRGKKSWRYVAWLIGVNNLRAGVSAATIWSTLQPALDQVRADGATVVLLSVTPWKNWFEWTAAKQTQTAAYNALLANYCATYPSQAKCVDTYAALGDAGDATALKAAWDSGDGLHPNQAGLDAIAAAVKAVISP